MIAGAISEADEDRAPSNFKTWSSLPYGSSMSEPAEFIYGNDTVYFAQPSFSQLVPGGSAAGIFNKYGSISLKDAPSNALPLTGRNAPRSNNGAVLRYAPPTN